MKLEEKLGKERGHDNPEGQEKRYKELMNLS